MRSSEEMGYVIYQAAMQHQGLELRNWEELGERAQEMYRTCANAMLEYLFEHGRISSYLNVRQLEECTHEYRTYLEAKNSKQEVEPLW